MDESRPVAPLTAAEIPWRLEVEPDDSAVDLLLFDDAGLFAYARSQQDDNRILRAIVSALLAHAHDARREDDRSKHRIALLVAEKVELLDENRRLRALGEDV
jgi:hypothetical protein